MAEQEYQVKNARMLVIAAVLGFVAIVLFYWHAFQLRQENSEDLIPVLRAKKELFTGDKLDESCLEVTRIPQKLVPTDMQDDVCRAQDLNVLMNMELIIDVAEQRIMRWSYVIGGPGGHKSDVMPRIGYKLVPFKVNKDTCPPDLSVGDHVDLMTTVVNAKGQFESMPVMRKVLVKAINGAGRGASSRNIDSVSVEVPDADAKDLLAFKQSPHVITMLVCNSDEPVENPGFNPVLRDLIRIAPPTAPGFN